MGLEIHLIINFHAKNSFVFQFLIYYLSHVLVKHTL